LKWLIFLVLIGAIGAVGWQLVGPKSETTVGARPSGKGGFKGKGGRGGSGEATPVLASMAETADVPIYLDGLGTARALNTVTVQPLVDGRLLSVDFKEGQDVKRGDLLARIDPAIYEAQLAQAVAKKAQDEAQLADALRELDRVSKVGPIATLQKSVDTARAKVAQFEALVKADQAAIDLARTQLGYTRITAPIDGRTGIRMVDEGNVVRAGATTGIVIITQVQPIAVLFNLPQQQLARINTAILASGAKAELAADALAPDGRSIIERGILSVVDNQVDQTTGTIRLKAEFPNRMLALWPGQFVNIRIEVENLRGATVVPTASVQQGPSGPYVFVVSPEGTARMRPVRIAAQDERIATIANGVKAGEQVVTSSFSRIREDSPVTVTLQPIPRPGETNAPSREGSTVPTEPRREFTKGAGEGKRGKRREAAGGAEAAPAAGGESGAASGTKGAVSQ
jgi:multidrug efflux system membrane fusion protein